MQVELHDADSIQPSPGNPGKNAEAVDAVAKGIQEFGLPLLVSPDIRSLLPPDGCSLIFYEADVPPGSALTVWVVPHVDKDYMFVTWTEFDVDGNMSLVGDTRGCRRDLAAQNLARKLEEWPPLARLVIKRESGHEWAGPWNWNRLLYPKYERYLVQCLGLSEREAKTVAKKAAEGMTT